MPDSTKQLALRVNTDAPEKLTMRLDEKVLETLERTEFSVITLLDKSGNAVMQYSLSDLRSVYDQYGLSGRRSDGRRRRERRCDEDRERRNEAHRGIKEAYKTRTNAGKQHLCGFFCGMRFYV